MTIEEKKKERAKDIIRDFNEVENLLNVIGDKTRQQILLTLMTTTCKEGLRVGEITEQTYLSRPAVSHQLKILKESGLVKMREEGTKNFYYISVLENIRQFGQMQHLLNDIASFFHDLEVEQG